MAGVLCGDLLLFHTARKLGPKVYEHRWIRGLLTPERRERISRLYARYGGRVIFFGRYMSVMRVLVFSMAAVQGMRTRTFLLWDALALCLSAPLLVSIGYIFARSIDRVAEGFGHAEHLLAIAAVAAFALALLGRTLMVRRRRQQQADAGLSPRPPRAASPRRPGAARPGPASGMLSAGAM